MTMMMGGGNQQAGGGFQLPSQPSPNLQPTSQGISGMGGFSPIAQSMQSTGNLQQLPQLTAPAYNPIQYAAPTSAQNLATFGTLAGAQIPQNVGTAQDALAQSQQYIAASTPRAPTLPTLTPQQRALMQNQLVMRQIPSLVGPSNVKGYQATVNSAMPFNYNRAGGSPAFLSDLNAINSYNAAQQQLANFKPPATSYAPLPSIQAPNYSTVNFQ